MPPPLSGALAALVLVFTGAVVAAAEESSPLLEALEGRPAPPWTAESLLETMIPWADAPHDATQDADVATSREPVLPEGSPPPPLTEHLAAFVPADTAVAFFDSVDAADDACASMSGLLMTAFPDAFDARPDGDAALVARTIDRLGLPPIWRANPGVRTGLRRIAVVVDDVDLSGAAGVALLGEVDDLSLLLGHRRAGFRWEDGHRERFRVEGLDATTDDGSVRSHFAYESGIAVFSTSRALRERILALVRGTPAGAAAAPRSMRETGFPAAARGVFPKEEEDVLFLVPDAFLATAIAPHIALKRSRATRCMLERLRTDGAALRRASVPPVRCPEGGSISPRAGAAGASCTVHGCTAGPVPLSDVASVIPSDVVEADALRSLAARVGLPRTVSPVLCFNGSLQIFLSRNAPGTGTLSGMAALDHFHRDRVPSTEASVRAVLTLLETLGHDADARVIHWFDLTGRRLPTDTAGEYALPAARGTGNMVTLSSSRISIVFEKR
jgi:hypothetical protein